MKKQILLGAALLSLMATSCSNDDVIDIGTEVVTGKIITLNATINNGVDTRLAYKDDGKEMAVAWTNSESFKMYKGTNGTGSTFTNSADATDKFKGEDIEGDGKYYAVYGEGITNASGTLSIDLSDAQVGTAADNGIKEFMLATADALTSETSLEFKHKLTVLKLTLTIPEGEKGTTASEVKISGLHNKASYALNGDAYSYDDGDNGDITATNDSKGFAITSRKITAYVAVFPEKVSANQVKITAKVGDNEYAYTIGSERGLVEGQVTPVETTLYWTKNFKPVYTRADHYKWDAETSYGGSKFSGADSKAQYSCKYAPTMAQAKMYLGAGIYWDEGTDGENQQTFTANGTTYHSGVWMMKKEHIEGFSTGKAKSVGSVSSTSNSECWHVGRPENAVIDKYFFLPAAGVYLYGDAAQYGRGYSAYWLSDAANSRYPARLFINQTAGQKVVSVNGGGRDHAYLPLVAE